MSDLEEKLLDSLRDGRLPCAFAFRVAQEMETGPETIGAEADRLGIRISRCQLGLFGYKAFGRKGILHPFDKVPEGLAVAMAAAADGEKIPCEAVWRVAGEHGLPRPAAGSAAETLGLIVDPCQLGCFLHFKAHHK